MSKHTPGPWTATANSGEYLITNVLSCGNERLVSIARDKDNANLIAAAPDLLEVLQSLVKTMRSPPTGPNSNHELDVGKAERAIAKALTGESK